MSIFVSGFNAFMQVSTSEQNVISTEDCFPTPVLVSIKENNYGASPTESVVDLESVSSDVIDDITENRGKKSGSYGDSIKTILASDLKDIVITWDRILYLWKHGHLTSVGGASTRSAGVGLKPFNGFTLQSVCGIWNKLIAVDENGQCLTFSPNSGTSVIHITSTKEEESSAKSIPVVISANETRSVVLLGSDRRIRVGELNNDNHILLRPLNCDFCIKSVSCGKHHSLLLSAIGVVFSFGNGSQGQLGHGTVNSETEPRTLKALEGISVAMVSAGGWHSMALSDFGDVYVWGWNEKGQLGLPCHNLQLDKRESQREESPSQESQTSFIKLSTVLDTSGVTSPKKDVNLQTSTGYVNPDTSSTDASVNVQPFPVVLEFPVTDPDDVFISKIACGSRHSVSLFEDGRVFTWGCNNYGQLGHGDTISRDCPTLVKFFPQEHMKQGDVFAGLWNTVFVTNV